MRLGLTDPKDGGYAVDIGGQARQLPRPQEPRDHRGDGSNSFCQANRTQRALPTTFPCLASEKQQDALNLAAGCWRG